MPAARLRPLAAQAATVAALVVATYAYYGYRYGIWPQNGFLDHTLRYDGELKNDWHTSLPPVHWALTHTLGLLPFSSLEPAVFVLWLIGIVLLWTGFTSICATLGLSRLGALGAGLVAIVTAGIGGVGASEPLFGYLYPTGLAFSLSVCALAALLRSRVALAGALLGLATLIHPNVGVLATGVIGPAGLLWPDRLRNLVRFAVPWVALCGVALIKLAGDQSYGSPLSAHRRFELLAEVRQPHHMLYSAFPPGEYIRSVLWLAAAAIGLALLRRSRPVRMLGVLISLTLVLQAMGAAAGEHGGPLAIVQAQTSRVSPFIVIAGVLLAAAALTRLVPRWAAPVLTAIALVSPYLHETIVNRLALDQKAPWVTDSGVEAGLVLAALGAFLAVAASARLRGWLALLPREAPAVVMSAALALTTTSLVSKHDTRVPPRPALDAALVDVAHQAERMTRSGDLVMTPPDQDGFRFFSHRPVVVEFGTFRYGKGDAEWIRRILDLTQNQRVLDPSIGRPVDARVALIGRSYDAALVYSAFAVCRYHPKLVVARTAITLPRWAVAVYRNPYYELLGVKAGACSGALRVRPDLSSVA